MATRTSAQDGPWGDSATWGAAPPGDGDTAVIGHTVTDNTGGAVGTSGASNTAAVTINTAGRLVLASTTARVLKGGLHQGQHVRAADGGHEPLLLQAGSKLHFNVPADTVYELQLTGRYHSAIQLRAEGTAGSRCEIKCLPGGGALQVTSGGSDGSSSQAVCDHTDFTNVGDADHWSLGPYLNDDVASTFNVTNCTFDNCGEVTCRVALRNADTFIFNNNRFSNSPAANNLNVNAFSGLATPGQIIGNSFDQTATFSPGKDCSIEDNYFPAGYVLSNETYASFKGNFIRKTTSVEHPIYDGCEDCYFFDDHEEVNPHFIQVKGGRDQTVLGCVFEYVGDNEEGECISWDAPGVSVTWQVKYCVCLKNGGGGRSGALATGAGGPGLSLVMEHNTALAGSEAAFVIGEAYAGHAGIINSFKSNIGYGLQGGAGTREYLLDGLSATADMVAAADATHNGKYGLKDGSEGGGYNLDITGTPGDNDVVGDPDFVDVDRNLAAWDASLGGAGSSAAALARLAADPALTRSSLIPWVRQGFAPQNAAYATAGHDGTTVGAVAADVPTSPASRPTPNGMSGMSGMSGMACS